MSTPNALEAQTRAVADLLAERRRQDDESGGPGHDDQRDPFEWLDRIRRQASEFRGIVHGFGYTEREHAELYQAAERLAALPLAMMEQMRRVGAMTDEGGG